MLFQGTKVMDVSLYITFQCLTKWAAQDNTCKNSGSKYEYELQELQRCTQCHQQLLVAVLDTDRSLISNV